MVSFLFHSEIETASNVCRYMESSYGCLTNSTVVIGAVGIIDSRYFYETQGTGQVTSLIGQKALASFLRLAFTHTDFLTP